MDFVMQPASLETLIDMWDSDANVNMTDPGAELIRIPVIHAKYVRQLSAHSLSSKKWGMEISKLRKLKWEYYNGRLDDDDLKKYGWQPFKFLLKSDISVYIDADDDLLKLQTKKAVHDEAVQFCNAVLKELNNRTWQLKEYMSWEKFIQGQH